MTLVAHGKNDTGVKTISGINRFQKVSDIKGVVHGSCSAKISIWWVIWKPYAEVYQDAIELVQKEFVMHALDDTNGILPYIATPYKESCEKLGLVTLSIRRSAGLSFI